MVSRDAHTRCPPSGERPAAPSCRANDGKNQWEIEELFNAPLYGRRMDPRNCTQNFSLSGWKATDSRLGAERRKTAGERWRDYRILVKRLRTETDSFVDRVLLKTFQNLNVSSPAPVTIASPSGDMAR